MVDLEMGQVKNTQYRKHYRVSQRKAAQLQQTSRKQRRKVKKNNNEKLLASTSQNLWMKAILLANRQHSKDAQKHKLEGSMKGKGKEVWEKQLQQWMITALQLWKSCPERKQWEVVKRGLKDIEKTEGTYRRALDKQQLLEVVQKSNNKVLVKQ